MTLMYGHAWYEKPGIGTALTTLEWHLYLKVKLKLKSVSQKWKRKNIAYVIKISPLTPTLDYVYSLQF